MEELELTDRIDAGSTAVVWRGTLRGRYDVAVKQLLFVSEDWKDEEVRFFQRLRHPRLVMFLGTLCFEGQK